MSRSPAAAVDIDDHRALPLIRRILTHKEDMGIAKSGTDKYLIYRGNIVKRAKHVLCFLRETFFSHFPALSGDVMQFFIRECFAFFNKFESFHGVSSYIINGTVKCDLRGNTAGLGRKSFCDVIYKLNANTRLIRDDDIAAFLF